jgi:hypothetical protein
VSALLFTVFITFFQNGYGSGLNDGPVGGLYMWSWALASMCSVVSVACSVTLLIALSEMDQEEDSNHFVRLFSELTFGLGVNSSAIALLVSLLFAMLGLLSFLYLAENGISFVVIIFSVCLVGWAFSINFLALVSSLKISIGTQQALNRCPKRILVLDLAGIKQGFKKFVQECHDKNPSSSNKSFISLPMGTSIDDFIEFLIDSEVEKYSRRTEILDAEMLYSYELAMVSCLKAKAFYQQYLEACVYTDTIVDIDSFMIVRTACDDQRTGAYGTSS